MIRNTFGKAIVATVISCDGSEQKKIGNLSERIHHSDVIKNIPDLWVEV